MLMQTAALVDGASATAAEGAGGTAFVEDKVLVCRTFKQQSWLREAMEGGLASCESARVHTLRYTLRRRHNV